MVWSSLSRLSRTFSKTLWGMTCKWCVSALFHSLRLSGHVIALQKRIVGDALVVWICSFPLSCTVHISQVLCRSRNKLARKLLPPSALDSVHICVSFEPFVQPCSHHTAGTQQIIRIHGSNSWERTHLPHIFGNIFKKIVQKNAFFFNIVVHRSIAHQTLFFCSQVRVFLAVRILRAARFVEFSHGLRKTAHSIVAALRDIGGIVFVGVVVMCVLMLCSPACTPYPTSQRHPVKPRTCSV
jgi:hypothetical protein